MNYKCPTCSNTLNYVEQFNQWYCYTCKEYKFPLTEPQAQPHEAPISQNTGYDYHKQEKPDVKHLENRRDIWALNELLKHQDNSVRWSATAALGNLADKGLKDASSVLLLNKLLKDSDMGVCVCAAKTLEKMEPLVSQLKMKEKQKKEEEKKLEQERIKKEEEEKKLEQERIKKEEEEKKHKLKRRSKMKNMIEQAEKYEYSLNYSKAADIYEKIEMWDEARRCREKMLGGSTQQPAKIVEKVTAARTHKPSKKANEELDRIMSDMISIYFPNFIDSGNTEEMIITFHNKTTTKFANIALDFTEMKDDFEVSKQVMVKNLKPGKLVKQKTKIKPKYDEGTFPITLRILVGNFYCERHITIKVGGTEIY